MAKQPDLVAVAKRFADEIQHLLNTTVCHDARLGVINIPGGQEVSVGTGLGRNSHSLAPTRLIAAGDVPLWLTIGYKLFLDTSDYLTVGSSVYMISAGEGQSELLHYDYEREKVDYPDAHLQIRATSPEWEQLLRSVGKSGESLHKLHFPVGGRRYRPAVEDILESLIIEGFITPRDLHPPAGPMFSKPAGGLSPPEWIVSGSPRHAAVMTVCSLS